MKTIVLFLCFILCFACKAEINPWISASALWGQGGVGIAYKNTNSPNLQYVISDDFVYSMSEAHMTYNEASLFVQPKNFYAGFHLRYQLEKNEESPFVGYRFFYDKAMLTFSIYNELEYRHNPYFYDSDYFRSSHTVVVIWTNGVFGEKSLRPFIADSIYFNMASHEMEKNRLYVGYFFRIDQYSFKMYYIPKVWGVKEKEWDDSRMFGASIQRNF